MAKSSQVQEPNTPSNVVWKEQKSPPKFKKLQLSIDANYKVKGKYSGREYLFPKAGAVVDVEEIDVDWMLSLRQGERQCCGGGGGGNVVFVLVKE